MTGIHPYCIVLEGHEPPADLRGLDGAAVRVVSAEGVSVWCSQVARRPKPELEPVRTHHRVVWAACTRRTPLPFRFGQWFPGIDRLEGWLAEEGGGPREALEAVAGALEFALRMDPVRDDAPGEAAPESPWGLPAPDAVPAEAGHCHAPGRGEGAAYLRALARRDAARTDRRRRGEELLHALAARLDGLVRRATVDAPPVKGSWASAAHLVPRGAFDAYRATAEGFAEELDHVRVRITGPWPPYSFSELHRP